MNDLLVRPSLDYVVQLCWKLHVQSFISSLVGKTDGGKLFLRASQQTLPVDDVDEEEQEVAEASGQKHSLKAVSKGRMRHRPSHRLLGCSELATFEDDEDESRKAENRAYRFNASLCLGAYERAASEVEKGGQEDEWEFGWKPQQKRTVICLRLILLHFSVLGFERRRVPSLGLRC